MTQKTDPSSLTEPAETRPRSITSTELLGGQDEIVIQHNGSLYRLRLTRQDKLILTK